MRAEPPTLTWIAFLGTVRRYTVLREPGISLGPPRVVVAGDDVAETWLPSMRAFLEAHPMGGVRTQAPIPVDPSSRALTSFAVSPGGRIQALAPLRENGVEMLTTPYALVELNAQRNAWRRLVPGRRFARGSLLRAGARPSCGCGTAPRTVSKPSPESSRRIGWETVHGTHRAGSDKARGGQMRRRVIKS